jgi:hypothetical protein
VHDIGLSTAIFNQKQGDGGDQEQCSTDPLSECSIVGKLTLGLHTGARSRQYCECARTLQKSQILSNIYY